MRCSSARVDLSKAVLAGCCHPLAVGPSGAGSVSGTGRVGREKYGEVKPGRWVEPIYRPLHKRSEAQDRQKLKYFPQQIQTYKIVEKYSQNHVRHKRKKKNVIQVFSALCSLTRVDWRLPDPLRYQIKKYK